MKQAYIGIEVGLMVVEVVVKVWLVVLMLCGGQVAMVWQIVWIVVRFGEGARFLVMPGVAMPPQRPLRETVIPRPPTSPQHQLEC